MNLKELEEFFKNTKLPVGDIQLNKYSRIFNVRLFIDTNIATLKHNTGNKHFYGYYYQLLELHAYLTQKRG